MAKKYLVPVLGLLLIVLVSLEIITNRIDPIVASPAGVLVSPPTIPHTLVGREGNCLLCHQDLGPGKGVKQTPHPERRNCQQCHIPQTIEQG